MSYVTSSYVICHIISAGCHVPPIISQYYRMCSTVLVNNVFSYYLLRSRKVINRIVSKERERKRERERGRERGRERESEREREGERGRECERASERMSDTFHDDDQEARGWGQPAPPASDLLHAA